MSDLPRITLCSEALQTPVAVPTVAPELAVIDAFELSSVVRIIEAATFASDPKSNAQLVTTATSLTSIVPPPKPDFFVFPLGEPNWIDLAPPEQETLYVRPLGITVRDSKSDWLRLIFWPFCVMLPVFMPMAASGDRSPRVLSRKKLSLISVSPVPRNACSTEAM